MSLIPKELRDPILTVEEQESLFAGKSRDRITLITSIHFQQVGEQPSSLQHACDFFLSQRHFDGVYSRKVSVGRVWKELDFGWWEPDQVGLLAIENLEGSHFEVNPTDEELAAIQDRVVTLCHREQYGCLIRPRRFFISEPDSVSGLGLVCKSDHALCRVSVYPK